MRTDFQTQGFVIVRKFLSSRTAKHLRLLADKDPDMQAHSHAVKDAAGKESRLALWYRPGGDVFSRLSCSDKMHAQMAEYLGGPASFFHAKLMQKRPEVGGSWEWHQDYGYWYRDGFLSPNMASCFVALDPAMTKNGCLQVIPGSHKYGRIDHEKSGQQAGADMTRVDALIERHGITPVELNAGDAVYFHSNLLHMSGPNLSDCSRLSLITSFFRADNISILPDRRFAPKDYKLVAHDAICEPDNNLPPRSGFLDGETALNNTDS